MPTLRQKKVAKMIVESIAKGKTPTGKQMLESANYAPSVINTHSTKIIQSDGVQEALEELGFTESNAMKVVTEIMLNPDKDANARLKATDQVFKVKGSYAPEKSLNVNIDIPSEARIKSKEAISQFLNSDGHIK